MPENPYAQYANPYTVYSTPGTGQKPGTGFKSNADGTQSYIPGSKEDPRTISQQTAASAGTSAAIQAQKERELADYRFRLNLSEDRIKREREQNAGLKPSERFDNTSALRRELDSQIAVKAYRNALPSYASALRAADTTAGDLNLIYAYAKIMDPDSVVREGEANSVATLGSYGQQLYGEYSKQLSGNGRLTPDLRRQLLVELRTRVSGYDRAYNAERARFRDLSEQQGINPELVVGKHLGDSYADIENRYWTGDPNSNGQRREIAAGATRTENDPKANAIIDAMVRAGASDEQIAAALKPLGYPGIDAAQTKATREFLAAHPDYQGSFGGATRQVDQSVLNRISASPVGTFGVQSANALSAGLLDEGIGAVDSLITGRPYAESRDAADQAKNDQAAANPGSALAGNIAGGALATLGGGGVLGRMGISTVAGRYAPRLATPMAGDIAYGAAYGAGESNDNRLLGATIGGTSAGGGSFIGSRATGFIGRGLRGVRDPAVRYLDNMGVRMTGGQAMGGLAKSIEDKLTSVPFVGDAINARRREGVVDFNRAALEQAGAPVRATIDGVGQEGIAQLEDAVSQGYDNALGGVNIARDAQFDADFAAAQARGAALPQPMADNAAYTLNTRVGNSFDPNGLMTGNGFQQSIRGLRRDARSLAQQPYGNDFGDIAGDAQDALEGMLDRQAPGVLPQYRAANEAYRNMMTVADAAAAGKNQIADDGVALFTPAQLNTASTNNTRRMGGKMASVTGRRPLVDLATAGQQVLPSKVPNSGTADRTALALLPAAIGGTMGGGAGAAVGDPGAGGAAGAGIGLTAGLLNTRAGQQALTTALLRRPQVLEQLGNGLYDRRAVGGFIGSRVGTPLGIGYALPLQ